MNEMPAQVYSVCGISIVVKCDDKRQRSNIDDLWRQIFVLDGYADQTCPQVHINLTKPEILLQRPHVPKNELHHSSSICVSETKHGVYLRCRMSVLDINIDHSKAEGEIDDDFWTYSIRDQREFFLLALVSLLRRQGLYGLHANAVARNHVGALIIGSSGSGKTTTTLSLLKSGWNFLSDDAIMLRRGSDDTEALALRKGFSSTETTLGFFEELNAPDAEKVKLPDGKTLIDIDHIYSDRFTKSCSPNILVFPHIVKQTRSELVPIDQTAALIALINQSVGIMDGKSWAGGQLDLLTQLVSQAQSYKMLAGSDVYRDPTAISDLLCQTLAR